MPVTTFLLDLDNTLLANDMRVFLPAYFAGLARRLAPFTQGEDLRPPSHNGLRMAAHSNHSKIAQ